MENLMEILLNCLEALAFDTASNAANTVSSRSSYQPVESDEVKKLKNIQL